MDLLKNALTKALATNADETDRWTKYHDEHRDAADNLDRYRKSMQVDIMVPIGSKALMPGHLYHTNEIFVSHSSQWYSKCTAHQAIAVCKLRMDSANERLKALSAEQEMYQNKLDLPAAQDAFRADGEQEIIEEYDEQAEQLWRQQHRQRVREQKERERAERAAADKKSAKADVDIHQMLDELELMEELEYEMESLAVDGVTASEEQLQKLISGELQLPADKKRVSHAPKVVKPNAQIPNETNTMPAKLTEPLRNLLDDAVQYTNVNSVRNIPDTVNGDNDEDYDDDDDDDDDDMSSSSGSCISDEDLPDQFKAYRMQASDLPRTEQIRFYRGKLREVQQQLRTAKAVTSVEELVSKSDRMFVCDHLQSEIDRLLDGRDDEPQRKQAALEEPKSKAEKGASSSTAAPAKRSVSFGADEIASFSKHQAPRRVSADLRNAEQDDDDDTDDGAAVQLTKSTSADSLSTRKPILKNKEAVQQERHRSKTVSVPLDRSEKSTEDATKPDPNSEPMVEFDKIMGDIFEKIYPKKDSHPESAPTDATIPDPLPGESFRDAHAPKQRISRFKASRQK